MTEHDDVITSTARTLWHVYREVDDRCDMELEDMPASHFVWDMARAVVGAGGVERLRSGGVAVEYPPLPEPDACDGASGAFAYSERAMRTYVDADRTARAPAPAAVEPVASEDDYKAWYIEAMVASNEAGIVGMSAADTIRYLATPKAAPAPVAGCPECHITHDLGACAKASPADALDAKRFRAIFGAAIADDNAFIDVFNIIVPENDAVTLDLIRDAIDAAMAAQQTQGGV